MLRKIRLAAVLGLVLTLGACSAPPRPAGPVLLRIADDPTVTFEVWFKTGSMDDPPGKEGLAYLTGQLLSEGSTTENSYERIVEQLYPLASSYSVRVDREMTVLSGRTHRDNLASYYKLFTDAYLRPAFKEEEFQRIKTDTLNYLENTLRFASDEELGKAALMGFMFEGSSYAHPPEGTVGSLKALKLDDVRAFYRDNYSRSNAVVALGGGFDAELVQRFESSLAELPDGKPYATVPPRAAEFDGRRLLLVEKADADASISFGLPIDVRRGEREFYALWIANSWLGEHRNSASRLFQVIREERGMNYGDYSYIEAFPNGGRRSFPPTHVGRNRQIFEVWIRTLPNAQAHFAVRAAMRELTRLVEEGMTEEQFQLTRGFLQKYVLHFADTTSARLGYALDDRFYGIEGAGHLARFREMLGQITREEVNAALRKHLKLDRMKFAIVTGDAAGLGEAIASERPSPMEYTSKKSDEILEEDKLIATYPLGLAAGAMRKLPQTEMFK